MQRVVAACALLLGIGALPAAHAATLYRCTGSGGETVFSSSTAGYAGCRRLGSYAPSGRRAPPVARKAEASLAAVRGSVETTARPTAPASLDGVEGSVQTTARAPLPRKTLFADVQGSVRTSARMVELVSTAPTPAGVPGRWSYSESRAQPDPAVAAAASGAAGDRVLRGAVYRVVRKDGSVEYTNLPPAAQRGRAVTMLFSYISTCMACNLHSPINWNSVRLNFDAYAATIRAASVEFGVDEAFLRAIIHAESAFNPRALSIKGAQGLMQLMPATAGDMGVLDAFDADQNIRGGARYLALLLRNFGGDERLAAAAYNAGPAAVQRYNGVPPYAETRVYVERVGALRKRYGAAAHPSLAAVKPAARIAGDL
ncbi:lytic transglycosylase [Frateuria sp. Soil773]|nr:lytic transglycosylase [Frateuria sp. Soil773]